MTELEILSKTDHTCLKQDCTQKDIENLCTEATKFKTASVCVPPCFVKFSKNLLSNVPVCTVIGFPNGYNTSETKFFECENALINGVDEIDVVINLTDLKNGNFKAIFNEITYLKNICKNKNLKVIVETCLLNLQEKKDICNVVYDSGADFIKTSTGFSKGGATVEDVMLFKSLHKDLKVKGAGGISDFSFAEKLIKAGCDRIGASRLVKLYKEKIY